MLAVPMGSLRARRDCSTCDYDLMICQIAEAVPDRPNDFLEHLRRQLARARVVTRAVIAVEQDETRPNPMLRTVSKRKGAFPHVERCQHAFVGDAAEGHDDPQPLQLSDSGPQKTPAGVDF